MLPDIYLKVDFDENTFDTFRQLGNIQDRPAAHADNISFTLCMLSTFSREGYKETMPFTVFVTTMDSTRTTTNNSGDSNLLLYICSASIMARLCTKALFFYQLAFPGIERLDGEVAKEALFYCKRATDYADFCIAKYTNMTFDFKNDASNICYIGSVQHIRSILAIATVVLQVCTKEPVQSQIVLSILVYANDDEFKLAKVSNYNKAGLVLLCTAFLCEWIQKEDQRELFQSFMQYCGGTRRKITAAFDRFVEAQSIQLISRSSLNETVKNFQSWILRKLDEDKAATSLLKESFLPTDRIDYRQP